MKLFYKRRRHYRQPNDRKSPCFYYKETFKDYIEDWIVSMFNFEIPENRYSWMRRFWYIEIDENKITEEDIKYDITNALKQNHIRFLTTEEANNFIKNETNLQNLSKWLYLIRESCIDELTGEEIPEKLLEIN